MCHTTASMMNFFSFFLNFILSFSGGVEKAEHKYEGIGHKWN